jgi:integrase
MSSRGNLQRKCVKGHPKADGKCSSRCIRWYPRLQLPRRPDGRRRFEALGGYPTRAQAEAALADALARRSHGLALDPAKLTVNQYLDRWLAHIRGSLRARTVARYAALLRDHVRPSIGARPLKQLTPLEVQAIYDRLAVGGRRDGKLGGLAPQHILAVHRCLHRALQQAVTWRLIARNIATDATPPPVPSTEVVALAPEQVAVLLDAAERTPSPWLGTWTVLAAATGARNGELCGLEWCDLDLDTGTVRFRQALTIVDPAVLPGDPDPASAGGARSWRWGQSSPLPAARSSLCHRSPSRRCAPTAASRPGSASPWYSLPPCGCAGLSPAGHPARSSWTWCSAPSGARRSTPTTPAAPLPAWPTPWGWLHTRTCCGTRWPRRWRPTRNRPASSPASCATPTAAPSPNGSTFTNFLRLHPGWPD